MLNSTDYNITAILECVRVCIYVYMCMHNICHICISGLFSFFSYEDSVKCTFFIARAILIPD